MSTLQDAAAKLDVAPLHDDDSEPAPEAKHRVRWTLNIPLLIVSAVLAVLSLASTFGLYKWQSQRLMRGMLDRAQAAQEKGDVEDRIKWMMRYCQMVPSDVLTQIELAMFANDIADIDGSLMRARNRLAAALASTGGLSKYSEERAKLRRLLATRSAEIGGERSLDAIKQIQLLDASESDAQMHKSLALAMVSRAEISAQGDRDDSANVRIVPRPDGKAEYWDWLSAQPLPFVLKKAIELNPDDTVLCANYLQFALAQPNTVQAILNEIDPGQTVNDSIAAFVGRLAKKQNDGQACWAVFAVHANRNEPELALNWLSKVAPAAVERLKKEVEKSNVARVARSWDLKLCMETASRLMAAGQFSEATALLEQLLDAEIPKPSQADIYLNLGRCCWEQGQADDALMHWRKGLEYSPDSLALNRWVAQAALSQGDTANLESARKAVESFEAIANKVGLQVEGALGASLGKIVRDQMRQQTQLARWQATVLRGNLEALDSNYGRAATLLASAFNSPLSVPGEERIQCGRSLAETYSRQRLWDLAGEALERCILISPNNKELHQKAASAWSMIGAHDRARSHIEFVDDGSFPQALLLARLTAFDEAAKPFEWQNRDRVRLAVQTARNRSAELDESGRKQASWQLEFLELTLDKNEVLRDNATGSEAQAAKAAKAGKLTERLLEMIESFGDFPEALEFVAVSLSSLGKPELAKNALDRLETWSAKESTEKARALVTRARALSLESDGRVEEGLKILTADFEANTLSSDLINVAIDMAIRNRLYPEAFRILEKVSKEKPDVNLVLQLGQLAIATKDLKSKETENDFLEWEKLLKEIEGDGGCSWRYLAATRLVAKAARVGNRDQLLAEASAHHREIEHQRPYWSKGAALGGQIAALRGDHEKAITYLQQAIRDGDTQVSNIVTLVSELYATKRSTEAQQELRRLSNLPDGIVPVAQWEIALAQQKGDLRSALDRARRETSINSKSPDKWMLVFQTANAVASSQGVSAEERKKLRAEAWDALEVALQVSGGKSIEVWNARLAFRLEDGDNDKVMQELKGLNGAQLAPAAAKMATAIVYSRLGQHSDALANAREAVSLGGGFEARAVCAQVYERMGDTANMLRELEAAYEAEPDNGALRERLALAYALTSQDIPWEKFDQLLADSATTTTPKARLLRNLIYVERGDEARAKSALENLEVIARSSADESLIAKRSLARYHARRWLRHNAADRELASNQKVLDNAKSLFRELAELVPAAPEDVVGYFTLLLESKDLDTAQKLVQQLPASSSILKLQLKLRLAQVQGADVDAVAESWTSDATGLEDVQAWEVAGRFLSELGFKQESVDWLERAYKKDASRFWQYAVGLARAGDSDKALEVCISQLKGADSLRAATLMTEIALMKTSTVNSPQLESAIADALKAHSDAASLLEAVGTLRLMQGRYAEAIALLEQVEKVAPNRVRVLNNLAVALSYVPDRAGEAMPKIMAVLDMVGRQPELLDSLAIVQLSLGKQAEARASLEEALRAKDDPRFHMRLSNVLLTQGDEGAAKKQWQLLDQEELAQVTMTLAETELASKLAEKFGGTK